MTSHYPHLLDPTAYPDYTRRPIRVPTWATFENQTQFTTLRAFTVRDGRMVDWQQDLDLYTRELGLGRVIWPLIHTLYAENLDELVDEIRRRGLYLFDLWGHVPGAGMDGMWSHITPPPGMVAHLEEALGERFFGIDNGEQDGRYVGSYATQQCPNFGDRFAQYLNFQRHFQRMGDDLGNHLTALVSLSFGHYFLKEGNHALLGAETAQALPSSQVYYAFIRGACKQYGVLWFGNASVYNRWGFKSYESAGKLSDHYAYGPEQGSSLSLLKRLLYTHYMYNSVAIGFEQSWIMGDNVEKRLLGLPVPMQEDRSTCVLSPVGKIQAKAAEFVARYGQPGTMHTPVALLLNWDAGWAVPRHLYSSKVYQVWGAMPYEAGDYLTHGVLSLLYPGYEDASYYRDERGFLATTPYGDMADCLLSDTPLEVLQRYGLVVAAGALDMGAEFRKKLRAYVAGGGHLVVTAANAGKLVPGLELEATPRQMGSDTRVRWADGSSHSEPLAFDLCRVRALPDGSEVLATCGDDPLVVRVPVQQGCYTVLLPPYGLNAEPLVSGPIPNRPHEPLLRPYELLAHARRALAEALAAEQLFTVGEGLGLVTCRRGEGEYTLAVYNNDLQEKPLRITSLCGPIESLEELVVDQSEKGQPGYWPTGYAENEGGGSGPDRIAGGDVRLFRVRVAEHDVRLLPQSVPPPRPVGRMLALRGISSIQEEILRRPTFFQHFDGVKVDWSYLHARDERQLERERDWLARQGVRILVDFSHGLNFYPDLTLLDTLMSRYEASAAAIADVLAKMALLGAADIIISLHRKPENHCDKERADARFLVGVRRLCEQAQAHGITVHLQHHPAKWHGHADQMLAFIAEVGAPNLRFALNTGHVAMAGEQLDDVVALTGERLGLVLLSAPSVDLFGQTYDAHAPLHAGGLDLSALAGLMAVPQVLDAHYRTVDEEYLDCLTAWEQ